MTIRLGREAHVVVTSEDEQGAPVALEYDLRGPVLELLGGEPARDLTLRGHVHRLVAGDRVLLDDTRPAEQAE
jgi:CTP:molybdopterin cytidylyltransferase MocA